MAEERVYTIPLRQKLKKKAKWRRTVTAVSLIKAFIKKHMKTDKVTLSKEVNEKVWSRGLKRPVGRIKVKAVKDEGKTKVQLVK